MDIKKIKLVKQKKETNWDRLEKELHKEGVDLFNNENIVEDYLSLPPFLDELPSNELGRYLNAFIMQRMYVRSIISKLSTLLKELEALIDCERARVFDLLPVKMSLKEKELNLYKDQDSKELIEKYNYMESKYKFYLDYMDSLEDAKFSLSREISRRGLDFADVNRGENIK